MSAFPLDLRTVLVMTVIAGVVMALCLATVSVRRPREGMGLWGAALLLQSLAYVLLALRGRVPDAVSVVLANTMLSGVFACLLGAIHRFHGRRGYRAWLLGPVAATAVLFTVFVGDYTARLVLAGTIFPAQIALAAWALYRPGHAQPGRGATLVAAGLALQFVVLVARAVAAVRGATGGGLLHSSDPIHHLTFLSSFITVEISSLGFIFMSRDRTDENNRRLAALDPLTGLLNRRSCIAALERDMAHAIRAREAFALLMVDVDHFKRINDRFGHLAGDEVLRTVAQVMRERVRAQDTVGRYGGEEFIVLLPGTPAQGASVLAHVLCRAIAETPVAVAGEPLPVTVSIGVFGGWPQQGDGWDTAVAAADGAMYEAKRAGRNRVVVAPVSLPGAAPGRGGLSAVSGFAAL